MITAVAVRNWQSLRAVDLHLGRFTVIMGSSNSGKSALVRALRAVTSNVRGGGHVTRGAKAASIAVTTDAGATVTLHRTATSGSYHILDPAGQEHTFTSLAGAVPASVTAALGIPPVPAAGLSLHVAGQLDPPYLLAESGATVARELTNVTVIFNGAREGSRRRAALATQLRTREADLQAAQRAAEAFRDLPARVQAITAAEAALARARELAARISRLTAAHDALVDAQAALAAAVVLPPVPSLEPVLTAHARLSRFCQLAGDLTAANHAVAQTTTRATEAGRAHAAAESAVTTLLTTLGTCPTCGQSTARIQVPANR